MNRASTTSSLFSRQPLSALGKTAFASLLGMTILCGFMSIFSFALLVTTAIVLLSTVLVAIGIRWAPLLGSLLSGYILYVFLFQVSFPVYHLLHPKDALDSTALSFGIFVIIVLILSCAIVAFGAGIGATVQNYRTGERLKPRWLAPTLTGMAGIVIGAIFMAALVQPGTATATTATGGEPTVHMGISSFLPASITVPKGSKLLLVDDGSFTHILVNGSWQNGTPKSATESGAPSVNNVQVSSGSIEIGPFTTAGTYHIYCSVHVGMTLTIVVQ
ncbi:MAG TPA: plastocyanin/azurin family copper-binding protein [Ktedonobacteraceae bacterium]|nr:plastocyanin/azurin family copper-binding protein [Ktedonobacteraceae bacterium]